MLVCQLLLNNGKLLVGKGEDWLYSAGELRAAGQFSTPFTVLVISVFILIDLSFCPWWLLSILSVTFHTILLSPRRTTDIRLDALDGLIYSIHRFRMCVSPVKGLTADILVRFVYFMLSFPLDHDLIRVKNC
jgi:hypothetical protein